MRSEQGFAGDGASVGTCRRFVADVLADWGRDDLEWPLVQIVSELATNAVIHARSGFTVGLLDAGDSIRLEVTDASVRRVQARQYGSDATTGRGLRLVAGMSADWGVDYRLGGKTVWVLVKAADAAGATDADALLDMFGDLDEDAPLATAAERSTEAAMRHRVAA